ncbi:FAD binding domain protein [Colletotrichum musicola]|uniref:FAD binding domain protein n=1 Tax=Colletotrichum musicola TaxID=2175873 RepID=A0A8H6KEU0_9PEZI|nr:FAD binding domain protein [Colletotrichum musicola]
MDHGSPTRGSIDGMLRRLNAGDPESVYDTASIPGFSIGNNADLPQATRVTDGGGMGSSRSWGRCWRSSSPTSSQADPRLGEVLRGLCQPDLLKHSEGFLSEDSLDELPQLSTVKDELRTQFPEDDQNVLDILARRICYRDLRRNVSYRRTFAISCLVDDLAAIKTLLDPETGICDDDLPLINIRKPGKTSSFGSGLHLILGSSASAGGIGTR